MMVEIHGYDKGEEGELSRGLGLKVFIRIRKKANAADVSYSKSKQITRIGHASRRRTRPTPTTTTSESCQFVSGKSPEIAGTKKWSVHEEAVVYKGFRKN